MSRKGSGFRKKKKAESVTKFPSDEEEEGSVLSQTSTTAHRSTLHSDKRRNVREKANSIPIPTTSADNETVNSGSLEESTPILSEENRDTKQSKSMLAQTKSSTSKRLDGMSSLSSTKSKVHALMTGITHILSPRRKHTNSNSIEIVSLSVESRVERGSDLLSQKSRLNESMRETSSSVNSMSYNFCSRRKFIIWRKLWLVLAVIQKKLGFSITDQQIHEMEEKMEEDIPSSKEIPCLTNNEVSLHLDKYRSLCPKAASIMHLGVSSSYVSDNAELVMIRKGFDLLLSRLANCIHSLSIFADKYKSIPTLSYTHFQLNRLTTVGRRACIWISDFSTDFVSMKQCSEDLKFLGAKGVIGNQYILFYLFNGDRTKIKELDTLLTKTFGFRKFYNICGHSYSRKININIMLCFSQLGASVHKVCTDIRLLCKVKEMQLPDYQMEEMQQRICMSARHLMMFFSNSLQTSADQWLEQRDDYTNRSNCISDAFVKADEILSMLSCIVENLKICPSLINRRVRSLIPCVEYELLLLEMMKHGADIKECQERFLKIENDVSIAVREEGKEADFMTRIKNDKFFQPIHNIVDTLVNPDTLIGRSQQQVTEFLDEEVKPLLRHYSNHNHNHSSIKI